MSRNAQNEIVALLVGNIKKKILLSIHKANYFFIIMNCTSNIGKTEQMSIIIKYISNL